MLNVLVKRSSLLLFLLTFVSQTSWGMLPKGTHLKGKSTRVFGGLNCSPLKGFTFEYDNKKPLFQTFMLKPIYCLSNLLLGKSIIKNKDFRFNENDYDKKSSNNDFCDSSLDIKVEEVDFVEDVFGSAPNTTAYVLRMEQIESESPKWKINQ